MENLRTDYVVDCNVFLAKGISISEITRVKSLFLPIEKKGKMIVLESVCKEVEKKGKSGNKQALKISEELYDFLEQHKEKAEFVVTEYHPKGVDDTIVDYCTRTGALLLTCDKMLFLKYKAAMNRAGFKVEGPLLEESILKKLSSLYQTLEKLTKENLHYFLKIVLGLNKGTKGKNEKDLIDFIAFSPEKRYYYIMDFIVDMQLSGELESLKEEVKKIVKASKIGNIDNDTLKHALKEIKELNLGTLIFSQAIPMEVNKNVIDRFLLEKGYESFEELKKYNPFKSEDELIEGIKNYYKL